MFGKLEKSDIKQIEAYLNCYFNETIYFQKTFEQLKRDALVGTFYGYMSQGELLGLFYFSNKNSLIVHYADQVVLGNLNLLKAIKHHRPMYIKGEKRVVEGIYRVICRTLSAIKVDDSILMNYDLRQLKDEVDIPYTWIEAGSREAISDFKFFINVENEFGRNVKSINDIAKTVKEMVDQENYYLVKKEELIIAQGLIEEETEQIGIIGGIFVDAKYRNQSLGLAISIKLTNRLLKQDKKPFLFVMINNEKAIHLYEKIGYKMLIPYRILTVRYQ